MQKDAKKLRESLSMQLRGVAAVGILLVAARRADGVAALQPADSSGPACAAHLGSNPLTFYDMHDGDQKRVSLDGHKLSIGPHSSAESWTVHAALDAGCTAEVDFRVPGKHEPPPHPLLATLASHANGALSIVFTDPSGKLAPPSVPLNAWVTARDGAHAQYQ
jgi:hypothetical protein